MRHPEIIEKCRAYFREHPEKEPAQGIFDNGLACCGLTAANGGYFPGSVGMLSFELGLSTE